MSETQAPLLDGECFREPGTAKPAPNEFFTMLRRSLPQQKMMTALRRAAALVDDQTAQPWAGSHSCAAFRHWGETMSAPVRTTDFRTCPEPGVLKRPTCYPRSAYSPPETRIWAQTVGHMVAHPC